MATQTETEVVVQAGKGSRADKTDATVCDHSTKKVRFVRKHGVAGDRETWVEDPTTVFEIDLDKIPDQLLCNDGSYTSAKAYGVRALLMDRASDFRKFGVAAYIEQMKSVCEELLYNGRFDAERGTSTRVPAVCPYLAQAIAEVKKIGLPTAMASLAAVDKDQRAALAKKLAPRIAELKEQAKAEVANAGTIDLSGI